MLSWYWIYGANQSELSTCSLWQEVDTEDSGHNLTASKENVDPVLQTAQHCQERLLNDGATQQWD